MKFTPTALTLPFLTLLVGFDGFRDHGPLLTAISQDAPSRRLRDGEIHELLREAERMFGTTPQRAEPAPPPKPPIELRLRHPRFYVHCTYPEIDGVPPPLRRAMRSHVKEIYSRAERTFHEFLECLEDSGPPLAAWEYVEPWGVRSRSDRLVSLSCTGFYDAGGAHPNTFHKSRTFRIDVEVAMEVRLADLFNPCTRWIQELSDRVLPQLRAAEASRVVSGEIGLLDERRLECWVLTPEGIEFVFAPYELGCYAEGSFFALVRYEDVRELLNPVGPASEFLR